MDWDQYKRRINKALANIELDDTIIKVLKEAKISARTIFIAGNGGSAALANHFACDLSKGANKDWEDKKSKRFKAISLCNNIEYMTAISNDTDYSEVFKEQLINLAKPGDLLILISSSGKSPNIVKALKCAVSQDIEVIGLCGMKGGYLLEQADYVLHVEDPDYEICEDVHGIYLHYLAQRLREPND